VISHPKNLGKGKAVLTAVKYAREQGVQVLVLMDGDGQHNADDIPLLIDPIVRKDAQLVIGSRFLHARGSDAPAYRKLGQKVLNKLTGFSAQRSFTDTQSGFRALSQEALESLEFASEGYKIESDMITDLADKGLVIKELPIHARYNVPNGSKRNPIAHGLSVFSHLVGLIGYRRPLLSFGIPGIVMTIAGLWMALYTYSLFVNWGSFPYAFALVSAVIFTLGFVLILTGLILNSLVLIMRSRI
jgi:glycosyltransferase involved in cell wall biosynthesis